MAQINSKFDCFLSHNSNDKLAVEILARRLKEKANLNVWLDKWNLIPGEPWQEELELALDKSQACVVFLGPKAISPWENEEMRSALNTRAHEPGFRVVPVLLPGADMPERGALPRFLSRLTWVDFRESKLLDDPEAFHRLVCGIKGIPPGHEPHSSNDSSSLPPADECPYRGLEAFEESHAGYFFGRDTLTQHLVETLRCHLSSVRFLAVLGASGSGKSSLVRAGLLPKLRQGALPDSADWRFGIIKPTAHPLQELAVQLANHSHSNDLVPLLRSLESDERTLHLQVHATLAGKSANCRYFLLIDQFEEVFSQGSSISECKQFIANLRYATTVAGGQTVVVITLRADFLSKAAEYPELAELLSTHPFIVSPMEELELRQAIEAPARLVGLAWEPGLVDILLKDTDHEPGALPLLEHALLRLCQQTGSDRTMRLEGYQAIKGVQGALADHADQIYLNLPTTQQDIVRRILLRLTQPGEGTADTRRRASIEELVNQPEEKAEVESIVDTLVTARLLTITQDQTTHKVWIDVAHEALIRGWPRLGQWIADDREGLQLHRRISQAAEEWLEKGSDESFLFAGARLIQALEWFEHNSLVLNPLERQFLNASEGMEKRQRMERESQHKRELVKARRFNIFSGLALIIVAVLAGFMFWWAQEAELQKRLNRQYLYVANMNLAEKAYENKNYQRTNELLSDFLPTKNSEMNQDPRSFAWYRLWRLLHDEQQDLLGHTDMVSSVSFSPDGKVLASGSRDKTIRLWDLDSGTELKVLQGHLGSVTAVAFAPDGKTLASASDDQTIKLWDTATGERLKTLKSDVGNVASVKSIAFSPDGKLLASGGGGSTALALWDLAAQKEFMKLDAEELGAVESVAFSPDGKTLATGDSRYNILLWDVATGKKLQILGTRNDTVNTVVFSPDGKMLASGNTDAIWLQDLKTKQERNLWTGTNSGYINSLAFSPDGKTLVSGIHDNTVRFFDVATGHALKTLNQRSSGGGYSVYSVVFSPDGKTVASGHWEGVIKLWKTAPDKVETLVGLSSVSSIAFSPDGKTIASGTLYNTVQIWDLVTGQALKTFDQPGNVWSVSFSPDGKVVFSGTNNTIKRWEAQTGEEVTGVGLNNS